ncbi:hypothetical protein [Myxococcus xanthus]|uniref:Uncharacterized protein n=1 Tax=Myxococcus xanthus TaxID=34 RepID=A0AAE6G617_MYXXA|nr:hypothetical protein [Myxococcus xanthus]QDE71629.1 hypothetical protein BHS09_34150 [Myxococcus xanthus]QDE78910.1 hypothetical protein BHS08_34175 [Myxococcus xanthus]QDE86284.1 hypothetical protein BHS07_34750 [Myxococcus xanthus]QDE93295.1 hypothetical protein BHS06_32310 [Myxococcus xanthus]QDF08242.1 hypothetical protein BHS04_34275 [Myxococcus xanthus]
MKMKIAAVAATTLLAASSFAQTRSLAAPSSSRVDAALTANAVKGPQEVAVVPALAVAFVAGALAAEVLHHHFQDQQRPQFAPTTSPDVLFDN